MDMKKKHRLHRLLILTFLIFLIFLSCSGGGDSGIAPYATGYGLMCRDYPQSIFCIYQGGGSKEPDRETCERVFQKVIGLASSSWSADYDQFKVEDYWKSYADEVEKGIPFTCDCDDFACTVAELLWREGITPDKISLVRCEVGGVNHLVCVVGEWMLCWLQRGVISTCEINGYRFDSYMVLSEPTVWRVWM